MNGWELFLWLLGLLWLLGKLALYYGFFWTLNRLLRTPSPWREVNGLLLRGVGDFLAIAIIFCCEAPYLLLPLWATRPALWYASARIASPGLRGRPAATAIVVMAGLALDLLIDLALYAIIVTFLLPDSFP